jgi:uncharacterized membrane protein YkgB
LERQLLLDVLGGSLRRNSTREDGRLVIAGSMEGIMNFIIRSLIKLGILKKDLDYHFLRALLVVICLFFGYQKWFDYEAQALIPYISHGPLIFWLYPVFGTRGATYFLGTSEWLFGALLLAGFWNKKAGILGALGFCFSMLGTSTIIPFIPGGGATSAGGFPAMTERVAFLMKDLVLFGVSVCLLRQDVIRVSPAKRTSSDSTVPLRRDLSPTVVMEGR